MNGKGAAAVFVLDAELSPFHLSALEPRKKQKAIEVWKEITKDHCFYNTPCAIGGTEYCH